MSQGNNLILSSPHKNISYSNKLSYWEKYFERPTLGDPEPRELKVLAPKEQGGLVLIVNSRRIWQSEKKDGESIGQQSLESENQTREELLKVGKGRVLWQHLRDEGSMPLWNF